MATFIALLRAVNVGGYGKLSMAALRQLLEDLGYQRVETYIQSGNAVFDAKASETKVVRDVSEALEKHTGARVDVIIRTPEELDEIIAGNPFAAEAAADGARVHVGLLERAAPLSAKAGLERIVDQYPNRRDRFHVGGKTLYLHLPDGAADTKFTGKALEKTLGGIATARNWNTVLKLRDMAAKSRLKP
jgi:uncharacterized protein (DUF1697 family)